MTRAHGLVSDMTHFRCLRDAEAGWLLSASMLHGVCSESPMVGALREKIMFCKLARCLVVCVALLWGASASGYVLTPVITPSNPVAGQPLSLTITAGGCDSFLPSFAPQVSTQGSQVDIHLVAIADPFCAMPERISVYSIGSFSDGIYSVRVFRNRYDPPFFPPHAPISTLLLDVLTLNVNGNIENVSVPVVSFMAIIILILLIVMAVALNRRRRTAVSLGVVLLIALQSGISEANENQGIGTHIVYVLLSQAPEAPSEQHIFDYFRHPDFPFNEPPLRSFEQVVPKGAKYFFQERAGQALKRQLMESPESARAKIERYLAVHYPAGTDMEEAVASLRADESVIAAYQEFVTRIQEPANLPDALKSPSKKSLFGTPALYGWNQLNAEAMWGLASGYAVVGVSDSGVYLQHPALRQFSPIGIYDGGNLFLGVDVGRWVLDNPGTPPDETEVIVDFNVDELEPEPVVGSGACAENTEPPVIIADYAGHGTHVAGLIAANDSYGRVKGTCRHCGIQMFRNMYHTCEGEFINRTVSSSAIAIARILMAQIGTQVSNSSFGDHGTGIGTGICDMSSFDHPTCLAYSLLMQMEVLMVASSGNHKQDVQLGAFYAEVIAAGGVDSTNSLWDFSPPLLGGNYSSCPNSSNSLECGTNYSKNFPNITNPNLGVQGLMAASPSVFSTVYPNMIWSSIAQCGDSYGTPNGDGLGNCTGTSMSSPLIAGIAGAIRSINPLVPPGDPNPAGATPWGVRAVLNRTTQQAQASIPWSNEMGYGIPDGEAAARKMLGTSKGQTVKNRVTPLFRFYTTTGKDYGESVSPQGAIALWINGGNDYLPSGSTLFNGYTFPSAFGTPPAPRANVYVLTTEYSRFVNSPTIPLYAIQRQKGIPIGCTLGAPGCSGGHFDRTLVTTKEDIEQAHADGYGLMTIQGYIYAPCPPLEKFQEDKCTMPGTELLYRACKVADDDCAVFLESERTVFEAAGYTAAYPSNHPKVIGSAYPAVDTDGDGLVDGFEREIGTNINVADTDGDGIDDGVEFPMDGVSHSDPCINNTTLVNHCS